VRAPELGDGVVGQLLHPALQGVGAGDLIARVVVEQVGDLVRRGTGPDPLADLLQLGLDAEELRPPPRVGLLEVDGGAESSRSTAAPRKSRDARE
jgi:hypothetical protein